MYWYYLKRKLSVFLRAVRSLVVEQILCDFTENIHFVCQYKESEVSYK